MKGNICLDLDGVIANIDDSIKTHVPIGYDYSSWLTSKDVTDPLCNDVMGNKLFWKNIKPYEDAWYWTNRFWGNGYNIHIVTARYTDNSMSVVEDWLNGWNIPYADFHFAQMGDKISVIKNLDAILMVEDNPYEVQNLRSSGVRCFLRKAWYNQAWWGIDSIDSMNEIQELNFNQ